MDRPIDPVGQFVQTIRSGLATLVHHETVHEVFTPFLSGDAYQELRNHCLGGGDSRGVVLHLLGSEYRFEHAVRTRGCDSDTSEAAAREVAARNRRVFDAFKRDFQRLYRCTYRKNFEPVYREHGGGVVAIDTDAGWGCMIRVGQVRDCLFRSTGGSLNQTTPVLYKF